MHTLGRVLLSVVFCSGLAYPQTADKAPETKAPDALHELSSALELLSHRTGRAVVQVFSTGFVLSDEDDSGDAVQSKPRLDSTTT